MCQCNQNYQCIWNNCHLSHHQWHCSWFVNISETDLSHSYLITLLIFPVSSLQVYNDFTLTVYHGLKFLSTHALFRSVVGQFAWILGTNKGQKVAVLHNSLFKPTFTGNRFVWEAQSSLINFLHSRSLMLWVCVSTNTVFFGENSAPMDSSLKVSHTHRNLLPVRHMRLWDKQSSLSWKQAPC